MTSNSEKLLKVLLSFGVDNNSVNDSKRKLDEIEKSLADISTEALEVGSAIELGLGRALDELDAKTKKNIASFNELRTTALRASQYSRSFAVAGTAVSGGIFASATKYINSLDDVEKRQSRLARNWIAQNREISNSFNRIGKVSAEAILPVLEKASKLANKTADFVEAHPDLIASAMNIGIVVTTLGTLGVALSKGVELYADVSAKIVSTNNLLAAKLMEAAAKKNLEASLLATNANEAATIVTPATVETVLKEKAASAAKIVGSALVLAIAAYVGAKGGIALGNAINKKLQGENYQEQNGSDAWLTFLRSNAVLVGKATISLEKYNIVTEETGSKIWEATKKFLGLGDAVEDAGDKVENSQTDKDFKSIMDSYNAKFSAMLVEQAQKRIDVIDEFNANINEANSALDTAFANAAEQLKSRLNSITQNYNENELRANEAYNENRAKIVRSSGEKIIQIERDHQEELRKLLQKHNQNVLNLVDDRDALGLVKENQRYALERSEKERETNLKIAREKESIAKQLQELERGENLRRLQARRAYARQVKDAQEQYKEEVERAKKEHEARVAFLNEQKTAELAELEAAQRKERNALIKERNAQLSDLNVALLTERKLKLKYYTAMLEDQQSFVNEALRDMKFRGIDKRASGGYVGSGLVQVGEEGYEYVLSNATTRQLEAALGGKINQQQLVSRLQRNVNITDNRRFDSRLSSEDRLQIRQDFNNDLIGALA